jgi:hypothetical protein
MCYHLPCLAVQFQIPLMTSARRTSTRIGYGVKASYALTSRKTPTGSRKIRNQKLQTTVLNHYNAWFLFPSPLPRPGFLVRFVTLGLREQRDMNIDTQNLSVRMNASTRCGYEIPGMTLLQAYPYTYSLLGGVNFEVLPLSSHTPSPMMLQLLETFWNSCCGIVISAVVTFFYILDIVSFVPLRQTLLMETSRGHSEPNQGKRMGAPVQ